LFLTRSLRRKMVAGLALIMVMLAALSISAISGLMSYRDLVNDSDFNINRGMHRSYLIADVCELLVPLDAALNRTTARFEQPTFAEAIDDLRKKFDDYRLLLDQGPPNMTTQLSARTLTNVSWNLEMLDQMRQGGASTAELKQKVQELVRYAQNVPPTEGRVRRKLQEAREAYHSRFWWVCATTLVVVLLFLGLVGLGYRWVFAPVRTLHQGASRVAQGDLDYRVELVTNDEMSELAEAFNKMTTRFQEIKADLDSQVRERSKQLVRSERLAGVGFLAAGVAHEINNPLTAIKWSAESLQSRRDELFENAKPADADVAIQYIDMISREGKRCQDITARLLDFSRSQDATRCQNDVTAIISEVLALVGHMSKFRDRTISFDRATPCYLEVNGPEIKQVVLNLVANALQSVDAGGRVELDIAESTDHVVIKVVDDGCGMTHEVQENLFEPFFTQNRSGKGTGLGLSISHRIVSDHSGSIEAVSDGPGHGSTFLVRLPRKAASESSAA
jgi:two-component system, NtrC family, sensor kinase